MTINEFLIDNEVVIRASVFFGIFFLMAVWEIIAPRRVLRVSKVIRWGNNIALVFFNSVLLRVIFPFAAVGVALLADENKWGLFNYLDIDFTLSAIASIILMDLVIYLQHVMVHAVPILWRLHRVHHADLDYDVTTGSRFHPIEIVISMLIKFSIILLLGAPAVAVIVFEIILNATAMFNHSNIRIGIKFDSVLRWCVVTPDMHRVHHSTADDETNSNFGFSLPWWDRLFGTYRDQPRLGHEDMEIGIRTFRDEKQTLSLTGMLLMPLKGKVMDYSINRRQWQESEESKDEK